MTALWLSLLLAATPKAAAVRAPPADAPRATVAPKREKLAPVPLPLTVPRSVVDADATNCGACHSTQGWTVVKFDHAKTGFPLKGEHAHVVCKACHPVDFKRALPTACRNCHSDAHAGELGGRCENCHEESSWSEVRFDADAHRRTAFPLIGAHAQLACEVCHYAAGARRFSRDVVECAACHPPPGPQTAAVDHGALPTDCRQCHQPWSWRGGVLPAHDACFLITAGPHQRISCTDCHTSLRGQFGVVPLFASCTTNKADCSSCHVHQCVDMARVHQQKAVLGYQCVDVMCAQCHNATRVGP